MNEFASNLPSFSILARNQKFPVADLIDSQVRSTRKLRFDLTLAIQKVSSWSSYGHIIVRFERGFLRYVLAEELSYTQLGKD